MIRLSAFADEISPDLPEQIAILKRENIAHIDLRGAWNISVLDLTDEQAISIKELLEGHGIKVAAIGSPIGKVPVDSPFDEHLERFERAIKLAHLFGTALGRIFSFYPPGGIASDSTDPDTWIKREDAHQWRTKQMCQLDSALE